MERFLWTGGREYPQGLMIAWLACLAWTLLVGRLSEPGVPLDFPRQTPPRRHTWVWAIGLALGLLFITVVGGVIHFRRQVGQSGAEDFVPRPLPALVSAPKVEAGPFPFQNPKLPVKARVDNIVSLMTLEEKIACLGTRPDVPRLGIRGTDHVEGLHGLAMGGPGGWGQPVTVPTTTFPQAIGMAETWDPEMIRLVGSVEAFETRYMFQSEKYKCGGLVVRAPNADLGRDPRWGRTEECYGEDPYFNGTMVAAMVKGLQGDRPKYWKTASLLKHFLANSNEDGRGSSSSDFDERLLREYYSVPFHKGIVEGGARAYMASYNAVNKVPMTVNPMLRDMTINEWGQDGIICTDAGALGFLVSDHKYFSKITAAAAGAIKAGIGQFLDDYQYPVREAVKDGLLKEAEIDRVLKGVFRVMIRLGLLDPPELVPYSHIGKGEEPWLTAEHKSAARLVTQRSIVLLKNKKALLPLNRSALRSIAVIGPRANDVALDWYSGTPPYTVTPYQGIRQKLGESVAVRMDPGDDLDRAAEIARASDYAIVCIGNHPTCNAGWNTCPEPSEGKESIDRRVITLPDGQTELVKKVLQANPRTIVVLKSSFPFALDWVHANVPAIVHMTHNSQEEGTALADVLFGDVNPGGRLVQTWPRSMDQLPPMMDYNIRHGRTYMYFRGQPLYPFGFGLSYTTFAYTNARVSASSISAKGQVTVEVDVKNTGSRIGDEVVQMYVRHLDSTVARPDRELKGFQRVTLRPGEEKTVKIPLRADSLRYWDAARRTFVLENDKVEILVGRSSADVAFKTVVGLTAANDAP
jgi:beta-glucosidase